MSTRYLIRITDAARARASGDYALTSQGPDGIAAELQAALRTDALFVRWRDRQPDPDDVDPALGVTDPSAQVVGSQRDLDIDLEVTTSISSAVLKHRLQLLAGNAWEIRDVRAG
ncbi:hypothetical protein LDO26_13095 [Luteimonas sp. BDR2-5]|uniref:hypothetical protein n=1 Tax=Proluteimonas luteida TaxID=2878685 RepID=UPI001E617A87|nr:hypothetical protein [Luteimonas sp. BDR2-5]MCD9029135.1 hypothetical protein [Luteimonas sp. BDR2-5]